MGDENTSFFHARASVRFRKNKIQVLHDGARPVFNHDDKERLLSDFYSDLLGSSAPPRFAFNLGELYDLVAGLSQLEAPFSVDEVHQAVLRMRSDAAPGPDGFGPAFFKTFCPLVKGDLMDFISAFRDGGVSPAPLNQAYITLLHKKPDVVTADGFWPISLQGCALKILCKVLTNRIQPRIPDLVTLDQSGFIRGRNIADNFAYAAELIQCCQKRRTAAMVLKLDFRKAFDTVEWAALDAILAARGFGERWRAWMACILAFGRASVLLNGVPGRWSNYKRGLRQGDPLPPYLFIIIADLLQRLVAAGRGDPRLLHPLAWPGRVPVGRAPMVAWVSRTWLSRTTASSRSSSSGSSPETIPPRRAGLRGGTVIMGSPIRLWRRTLPSGARSSPCSPVCGISPLSTSAMVSARHSGSTAGSVAAPLLSGFPPSSPSAWPLLRAWPLRSALVA